MPLSLLHKRRRKWMGRREKSGASPADGHSRNAGTPPPRAGRAAAQGTARPGGRAPQASRPTGPGGPVCRPYKNAETCPMNAVGAGPRPARGRGTPQGGFSCPCGAIHLQPLPYGFKKLFWDWVGEALGPPAGICTGRVGSVKPGAPTGPHQPKFLQIQGLVARREFRPAIQILRAGNDDELLRSASPVKGVRGKRPMDLGGTKWSRSPSDASPGAFCPIPRYSRRSPAKRVRREEEEQGNKRSFRR